MPCKLTWSIIQAAAFRALVAGSCLFSPVLGETPLSADGPSAGLLEDLNRRVDTSPKHERFSVRAVTQWAGKRTPERVQTFEVLRTASQLRITRHTLVEAYRPLDRQSVSALLVNHRASYKIVRRPDEAYYSITNIGRSRILEQPNELAEQFNWFEPCLDLLDDRFLAWILRPALEGRPGIRLTRLEEDESGYRGSLHCEAGLLGFSTEKEIEFWVDNQGRVARWSQAIDIAEPTRRIATEYHWTASGTLASVDTQIEDGDQRIATIHRAVEQYDGSVEIEDREFSLEHFGLKPSGHQVPLIWVLGSVACLGAAALGVLWVRNRA